MTVAALEALVLRECLRRGQRNLPQRFFRASAKQINAAWRTAVGSDLALPEVVGRARPVSVRITNAYLARVPTAAETDPVVADHFSRVIGMIDPPAGLLHLVLELRITKAGCRRRNNGPSTPPPSVLGDPAW